MKWIKNRSLKDILARVIALLLLQLPKSNKCIDPMSLFDYGIPRLCPKQIITLFSNVVGWRIDTWRKIIKLKYLQLWIYKNADRIWEHIAIERFKTISSRTGHKNLFHLKCIQKSETSIERCLPWFQILWWKAVWKMWKMWKMRYLKCGRRHRVISISAVFIVYIYLLIYLYIKLFYNIPLCCFFIICSICSLYAQ